MARLVTHCNDVGAACRAPRPPLVILRQRSSVKGPHTAAPILLFLFACACLAADYPRPDVLHMRLSVPGLAPAAVYCVGQWKTIHRLRLHRPLALLACCGACAYYLQEARQEHGNGPHYTLKLERLRGISMFSLDAAKLLRESEAMERQNSSTLFILHPRAAVYHLATGVKNPTRCDFPLSTTFGPHGQQQVIERIRGGAISAFGTREKRSTYARQK